jgi:hypothetical protein
MQAMNALLLSQPSDQNILSVFGETANPMTVPSPPSEKETWVQTPSQLSPREKRAIRSAPDLTSADDRLSPQKYHAPFGLGVSPLPLFRRGNNTMTGFAGGSLLRIIFFAVCLRLILPFFAFRFLPM